MMSFENVGLLKEGKQSVRLTAYKFDLDFTSIVGICVVWAYMTLFARVLVGNSKLKLFRWELEVGEKISLALSLSMEVVFLCIRLFAWYRYEIPVSVLMI